VAQTWAIPEPMRPQPRTPTFLIVTKSSVHCQNCHDCQNCQNWEIRRSKCDTAALFLSFQFWQLWQFWHLWQCLNDHRDSLATTDAGCGQSILRVATAK